MYTVHTVQSDIVFLLYCMGVWRFHQKLKGSLPTTLRALWLVGGILRCSVIGLQYILPCYWLSCRNESSMMSHQWVILLYSTELCYRPCYRPYSYVIVHVIVHLSYSLYSIVYKLCYRLCYRPCYRPYSYVIVHVIVHLSYSLYSIVYMLCYRPCYRLSFS